MEITDLPGVGPAMAEKLNEAGYKTLMSIASLSSKELAALSEITENKALKIIIEARKNIDDLFSSADKVLKKREKVIKLTTSSKEFDRIMGGGFESGAITECFGHYGISKTQIAHQLAVNVQLPKDKGGCEGKAIYIDTESTFRPERIQQIAKAAGLDPDKALKNIKVGRAFNSDHQVLLAEKAGELIEKENIKLIIVDSLTAHFRAEFIGRGTLADRQQKLNKHMHTLMRLADTHNICVYVTNQVMAKPDQFFGDPTEAIGGHVVGHASTFRVYLKKGKKGTRVAKLVDSPNLPEDAIQFKVTENGVEDV
ncbi:DNA repair and recombination protein RadA [Candidatus Woesearchaeota archaeon]|nr:DNA repair and recombination protein RadA [Candidatus Woesearchaeota archaeon]